MADMEEQTREETYLKLFYNRHPGLGAIEPGDTSPALATDCLLEAERDQSPPVSSPSSSALLFPEVFSIETLCFPTTRQVIIACCVHMPQILLSNDAALNISLLSDNHPKMTKSAASFEFYRNRVFSISWNRSWKLSENTLLSCLENDCAMMHRGGQRLEQ